MSNKIVTYQIDLDNPPALTQAEKDSLQRLAALPDDDIDFSDSPLLDDAFFNSAVRGRFYKPVKTQITLRIDADILHWFKTQQGGERGYQTAINAALRKAVEEATRR